MSFGAWLGCEPTSILPLKYPLPVYNPKPDTPSENELSVIPDKSPSLAFKSIS